jgi:hypothetical protein
MLKNDVAHGLTVSLPNRDKLTMRAKPLKIPDLILVTSKSPHWRGLLLTRARRRGRLILGRQSPQLSMGPPPHIH